jgi:hypothetical protein
MKAIMDERGWGPHAENPMNALRATLSRLRRAGEIRRLPDRRYALLEDSDSPNDQPGESDVSHEEGGRDGSPLGN